MPRGDTRGPKPPRYVGAGEGPSDLGLKAEHYLQMLIAPDPVIVDVDQPLRQPQTPDSQSRSDG